MSLTLSLLEGRPPPEPNPWPKRLAVAAALAAVVGSLLFWQFRYYPQQKQVERFMQALEVGDYRTAYQLWKPAPSYRFQDFLEDWGETTSFGRIRSYEIVKVKPGPSEVRVDGGRTLVLNGESSGVVVTVRINGQEPPVRIWVERKDKSLSFPPF